MSTTFKVDDVKVDTRFRSPFAEQTLEKVIQSLGKKYEAFSGPAKVLWSKTPNGLFSAVHNAYSDHYRLALRPDDLWLTITKVVASYVTDHAEQYRDTFVGFTGKKKLEVRRDNFAKGSPENDWPGVFGEFAVQIKEHAKASAGVFLKKFSTTGPVEEAAGHVILMDAMQKYFDYHVMTLCGIPEVTLLGTTEDWADLFHSAYLLRQAVGMHDWFEQLMPVLGEFARAAAGRPNLDFWQNLYKPRGGSGSDVFEGHIRVFFPRDGKVLVRPSAGSDIPSSLSKVPFTWNYLGTEFSMEFLAGIGFSTFKDDHVQPMAVWAVGDR